MFTPGQVPSASTPDGKASHQYILIVVPQPDGGEKYTVKVEAAVTVMADVAVLLPSAVVTVIVAVPTATAVTKPVALTVATAVLLDCQVTF